MKKPPMTLVALLLAVTVAAAPGVQAKKKAKKVSRITTAQYSAPGGVGGGGAVVTVGGNAIGGASFTTGPTERYVSVVITDTAGTPVAASIGQDVDGDMQSDASTGFCGATQEPVAIEPGAPVIVSVFAGPCTAPAPAPGAATTGEIEATFSNVP